MNKLIPDDIIEATRLTRAGRLTEASALLGRRLRGDGPAATARDTGGKRAGPSPRIIDVEFETSAAPGVPPAGEPGGTAMPEMQTGLRGMIDRIKAGVAQPLGAFAPGRPAARAPEPTPEGARFLAGSFRNAAGSRDYKLYVPSTYAGQPAPLVVMLHGCTQSPDDFAAGTRMNALAEEHACLVVYPGQTQAANAQKCWNWFSPADQQRDQGEPALIAGITRQVMRDFAVDARRVYVAGLSAGGAAAAIMAQAYPDLYAAAGVHSGLACGAARDIPSALAAMRNGAATPRGPSSRGVPTIVFHADKDGTVHPRNGDQVIAQSAAGGGLRAEIQRGQVPGGRSYTRTIHVDAAGEPVLEQWLVHGGGHAWSGGSAAGSYTDPQGPDASREMLRFFLEHPNRGIPAA